MKSVFFLSLMNGSAWGGSEEFWYKSALWMSNNHYKIGIGCYDWKDKGKHERIEQLKKAGCSIYLLPNKKGFGKNRAVQQALDSIPFCDYDLTVVNQGGWEDVLHAPFKNLYKRLPAYVLNNHNYNETAVLSTGKKLLLQQWIGNAKMNFGDTQKIFDFIQRNFNIHIDKKETLINPIASQPNSYPSPYPAFNDDGCTWVMFAELDTARKSQDILIKALSSSKWKARNWQLHLFGKGKDKELLEKLISTAGLENKILFKGYTNDIKLTLQDYHLLLQCTRIDAMPITVVEAMAMARPCVVSQVGDMPVWVEDGINGFVCDEVSVTGIDEALEKSWQQKSNWEAMGKRAFETFIKKYPQPYEEKIAEILNRFIP
jgi:glycosyltransferase involved in cell wall biosynthesis